MAKAEQGDTVRVHYVGVLDDGAVFDSTQGRQPLQFTIGGQEVIPAFERAVIGLAVGESTVVRVPAAEGYGPRQPGKVTTMGRDSLPGGVDPVVGQRILIRQADGGSVQAVVTAVDESTVTLDANHPLAGEDLTYRIELVEIVG